MLPLVSFADTVCGPIPDGGTVNVVPGGIVPLTVAVTVRSVVLSYFIVIVEPATKLDPVTVTDVPGCPRAGLSDIVGLVTVNTTVGAVFPPASLAETG